MFIKIQGKAKQKGNVILHLHIDDIIQRIDFQVILVGIVCPVYRIVEGQQMLFLREQGANSVSL